MKNKFFSLQHQIQKPEILAEIIILANIPIIPPLSLYEGTITFHNQRLTDIADPVDLNDAATLKTVNSKVDLVEMNLFQIMETTTDTIIERLASITPEILGAIPTWGGDVMGSLNMRGTATITGLADPINDQDAINLKYLNRHFQLFKSQNSFLEDGVISFGNHTVLTGLKNPKNPTDAVNLETLNKEISSISARSLQVLPLSGGIMTGNIHFSSSGSITGLQNPFNPTDAVNLQSLDEKIRIALKNLQDWSPVNIMGEMYQNLKMKGYSIQDIADPIYDKDAVNLSYLKKMLQQSSSSSIESVKSKEVLFSGTLNLDGNRITGLSDPLDPLDAVNLAYILDALSNITDTHSALALSGGSLSGPLNLQGHSITGVPAPLEPLDAVNLAYILDALNDISMEFSSLLPLRGGILRGHLDLGGNSITGLSDPFLPTDAVNLSYFLKKIEQISSSNATSSPFKNGKSSDNIDMGGKIITGLARPTNPTDAVNLSYILEKLDQIVLKTSLDLHCTQGLDLVGNPLTGLPKPINPTDAVTLSYLESQLNSISANSLNVLSLLGGKLAGDIDVGGNSITGLATPHHPTDAVNLTYLQSSIAMISAKNLNVLSLSGGKLSGSIDLDGNIITGLSNPVHPTDAVNVAFVKNALGQISTKSLRAIPVSGGTLSGDLNLDGYTITGLAHPVNPTDAVTLEYFKDKIRQISSKTLEVLPLTGGKLFGDIDLQSQGIITGLINPKNPTDAVNLQTLEKKIAACQQGIHVNTSSVNPDLQGNLNMAGIYTISDLADPINPGDAVNLQTLLASVSNINSSSLGVLSNKGGTISGIVNFTATVNISAPLYMNGNFVTNIHDPFIGGDAVNLRYLKNNFLPLSGGVINGSLDLKNQGIITGLNNPMGPTDAVNLQTLDMRLTRVAQQCSNLNITSTPVNPMDPVNLQSLNDSLALITCSSLDALSVTGGDMQGPIQMNNYSIKGLSNPIDPHDAISLSVLLNYLSYITPSTIGALSSTGGILHGNIHMGASQDVEGYLITGLANPSEPTDAVNLGTLCSFIEDIKTSISQSSILETVTFSSSGSLNMNGAALTGLAAPASDSDAVNMQYVNELFKSHNINSSNIMHQSPNAQNYISTNRTVAAFMINSMEPFLLNEISEEIRMGWVGYQTSLRKSKLADSYFNIDGIGRTSLYICKPGLYSLSASLFSTSSSSSNNLINLMLLDQNGPIKLSMGNLHQQSSSNISGLWDIVSNNVFDEDYNFFYITMASKLINGLIGWNIMVYDSIE
ncbi:hypothetical protein CLAVI_000802 [Candidatus Clavichlamydia salmonicola]|uniref:hypothetical protein n=1 Tax=Candidatus Clavichlamydia salmonicola TaxID=469812 RepID=UPI001891364A|nr:hypothetical protein [Candidatus Clavichlamydia salmonicola]MBF5051166.1 hypothetical protein [Candidatus Clavichlamydia salmonicola]